MEKGSEANKRGQEQQHSSLRPIDKDLSEDDIYDDLGGQDLMQQNHHIKN